MLGRRRSRRFSLNAPFEGSLRVEKQVVLERYSDNELWVVSDTPARHDEMLTLDRVGSSPPLSMPVRVASADVVMRDGVPQHRMQLTMVQQNELLDPPLMLGVLVRTLPVRVVEVSRSGCLLQARSNVEEGMTGELSLDTGGHGCIDHVKVTRCAGTDEEGSTYSIGVEFSSPRRDVAGAGWPGVPKISDVFAPGRSSNDSVDEPEESSAEPTASVK